MGQNVDKTQKMKLIEIWANIGEVFLLRTKEVKVQFIGKLAELKNEYCLSEKDLSR